MGVYKLSFRPIWENYRAIYFALLTRKRDIIRFRNRSKLVKGSLFAEEHQNKA